MRCRVRPHFTHHGTQFKAFRSRTCSTRLLSLCLLVAALPVVLCEKKWCDNGVMGDVSERSAAWICCYKHCGTCGGADVVGTHCQATIANITECCSHYVMERDRLCESEDDVDCIIPNLFVQMNMGVYGAIGSTMVLLIWSVCVIQLRKYRMADDKEEYTIYRCCGNGNFLFCCAIMIGGITSLFCALISLQCSMKHIEGTSKYGCFIGDELWKLLIWCVLFMWPFAWMVRVMRMRMSKSQHERGREDVALKAQGGTWFGRLIGRQQDYNTTINPKLKMEAATYKDSAGYTRRLSV